MSDIPDITELARLFLKSQVEYGKASFADWLAYQHAFEAYRDGHPHLIEACPDKAFREQMLSLRVRAFARNLLKAEAAKTAKESELPFDGEAENQP